jgi:hypothetical protein
MGYYLKVFPKLSFKALAVDARPAVDFSPFFQFPPARKLFGVEFGTRLGGQTPLKRTSITVAPIAFSSSLMRTSSISPGKVNISTGKEHRCSFRSILSVTSSREVVSYKDKDVQ